MGEDALVERNNRMMCYQSAPMRSVASLQNWVNGTWSIAREETAYLMKGEDLISLGAVRDSAIEKLVSLVEDFIIWICRWLKMVHSRSSFPCVKMVLNPDLGLGAANIKEPKHIQVFGIFNNQLSPITNLDHPARFALGSNNDLQYSLSYGASNDHNFFLHGNFSCHSVRIGRSKL